MMMLSVIGALVLAASVGTDVRVLPVDALEWATVRRVPVVLPVEAPEGTVQSVFEAENLRGEIYRTQVPAGTSKIEWRPFSGLAPDHDDYYTLRMNHYRANEAVSFACETARVAVVRGAFGDSIDAVVHATAAEWPKMGVQTLVALDANWLPQVAETGLVGRVSQGAREVRVELQGTSGWLAQRFRFGPWRVDEDCTFDFGRGETNQIHAVGRFPQTGYCVYAE